MTIVRSVKCYKPAHVVLVRHIHGHHYLHRLLTQMYTSMIIIKVDIYTVTLTLIICMCM
jgi:hypothetical protein